jgi:ABC-type uncharacterized transport system involved in gliding motility auxiliary subunit
MKDNNTITVTRGHIGQFASFIGVGALMLGVISLIWQGEFANFVVAIFAVAIAGIVTWVAVTPREFIDVITGRQLQRGTVAVFSTFLMIAIVVMAYTFLDRAVLTLDMTDAGSFTLSSESLTVLDRVNREIRITGFYSPKIIATREIDDQFFRLYEDATDGKVFRKYIDPEQDPGIATDFRAQDGDVFVSYMNEEGTVNFESVMPVSLEGEDVAQERQMTQAISRLIVSGNFTVYYDVSYGELDPNDNDTGIGMGFANQLLVGNGFNTHLINLVALAANNESIPEEATVIVLARPQAPVEQDVIDLLDEFLDQGGALYIMADALFTDETFLTQESLFNQYLWNNWGIRMLDAVVVDPDASYATPLDIASAAVYDSPITANINVTDASYTEFRTARAIEVSDTPPVNNGRLISSSTESYGETDLESIARTETYIPDPETDIRGPLTTAAFAFNSDSNGKIILVGDSDFATNGLIVQNGLNTNVTPQPTGNTSLFLDGMGWLTGFSEEVRFAPQGVGGGLPFIFVDTDTLDKIAFITMVIIPGIALLLGAGVWLRRSRS